MKPTYLKYISENNLKLNTLNKQIYNLLADAIVDKVFKGGEKLVERDLQKHFNVSRSPIREAFRMLEKKGLVEIIPRKGTFVKKVELKDIENSFAIRAVLEGLAAKEAYKKMTKKDRAKMQRILHNMKTAAHGNKPDLIKQEVYEFHKVFIIASKNDFLINVLRHIPIHYMWKRFLWQYSKKDLDSVTKRYRKLLQMFLDKNYDEHEVEKSVIDHVLWSGQKFKNFLVNEGKI